MTIEAEALRRQFEAAGQGHVFEFWDELGPESRASLAAELEQIDLELVRELGKLAHAGAAHLTPAHIEPAPMFPLERGPAEEQRVATARARGEQMLRDGRVAYLLVAGGQASRLGYDGPKGNFPAGALSRRTLFELFARKLAAARARFGAPPRWYVMTSAANDEPTRETFERAAYFGLGREHVFFFKQAMLPALDEAGRILLAARDAVFLAPNGHGGVLSALASSGALAHAAAHGVQVFSYFQVDNPLAPPADALFLGLHALEGAQMSSKVVKKRDAGEKVGVLARADGRLTCIEYSDLPPKLREARDEHGELVYSAGNIALHVIEREFVERLTRGRLHLPWHVAKKSIQALDRSGKPSTLQGYKFETFVFDALSQVEHSAILEVAREQEFSPIKNASGEDSPHTSRRDQCRLHAEWVRKKGLALPPPDADGVHPVEIDPLLASDEATFLALPKIEPRVVAEGHLYEHGSR